MAAPKREVTISFALIIFSLLTYSEAFDSFWFVQQWPPAVCSLQASGSCPGSGLKMFTIHGFWPQLNGKSVTKCSGSPFDIVKIIGLTLDLNKYWPDVISGNSPSFWMHEWDKHGTCSESAFNQAAYFQLCLNHRFKYDIMTALKKHGSGPNGQKKSLQGFKANIKQEFGKFPGLRCKTDTKANKSILTEVVICFDKDGTTIIDCLKDSCGQDFYF